ncbi:MAG TPA: GGDEF domain-containing protein [Polyangia bacterium]|jgi:diguanylate cyclase (GGDEF)-like protein|nr:GGDEF domain-containing protein [Polyangia bacterium]
MGEKSVGDPLDDTTRTSPAPDAQVVTGEQAYLLVMAGSNLGQMYKLDKLRLVIGRGDKADLRLVDDGISRDHARIVNENGQMMLEDLGSTNGTYCNGVRVTRQALSEGDKILLGSTTILKFSYQDQLEEAFQRQMSESALRDGLTHAYNKRYFGERIESELQYSLRHDAAPLSLIFLDIDHFKRINDVHGHQAGDQVLVQLATVVTAILGEEEIFARYGGEEFAIIVRGADVSAATALAERLRAAVEAHPFTSGDTQIPVTISVGVSYAPGLAIATTVDFVARADEALYAAKRAGRNRVCVAQPAPAPPAPVK